MARKAKVINNAFYEELGNRWYAENSHPIALLRKENEARNPWILETIQKLQGDGKKILDVGCGGGFLACALAERGHEVTGVDLSCSSLQIAKQCDRTHTVQFLRADATSLPFADESFDVVCAMDLLEHTDTPVRIIAEASRVLKKEGLFFFHTFNRNWLSWLIVIKGVEWCVPNTPPNMHTYPLFIKPQELSSWCHAHSIHIQLLRGLTPKILSRHFWKSLFNRTIDDKFRFIFSPSLKTGYIGYGVKREM